MTKTEHVAEHIQKTMLSRASKCTELHELFQMCVAQPTSSQLFSPQRLGIGQPISQNCRQTKKTQPGRCWQNVAGNMNIVIGEELRKQ